MTDSGLNKGLSWSVAGQVLTYAVSLVFTATLSRLVSPSDYGLMDMANTVIAFFMVFSDGGIAWSILQRKDIKTQEVRNLLWINVSVGFLLAAGTFFAAGPASAFYKEAELEPVLRLLSLNFAFSGLAIAGLLWMRRHLRAKELALIDLSALLVSGCVGVILAKIGWGHWALAIMVILRTAIKTGAVVLYAKEIVGGFDRSIPVRGLVNFGLWVQAYALISYSYKNLDAILIGRVWGSHELAMYAKALFVMNLPSILTAGALGAFAVPLLAKHQDDKTKYTLIYCRILRIVITLSLPLALFFIAFPLETIHFFYGDTWSDAANILVAFSAACLLMPVYSTASWIFMSSGRGRAMAAWAIASAILYTLAVFVSIDHGPGRVATAYSVVLAGLTLGTLIYAAKLAGMSLRAISSEIFISSFPLIFAAAIATIAAHYLPVSDRILFVLIYGPALVGITATMLFTLHGKHFYKRYSLSLS